MFVKLTFIFSVVLLFNEFAWQTTNGESEKMVQLPQSLIDELLKKKDDLEGVKELLKLVSASPSNTLLVTKSSTLLCPIRKLATGIRQLIRNLKLRVKTAKNMNFNDTDVPYRSKRVRKFMYVLEGLLVDIEETIKIGRELKPLWETVKTFLKEDNFSKTL